MRSGYLGPNSRRSARMLSISIAGSSTPPFSLISRNPYFAVICLHSRTHASGVSTSPYSSSRASPPTPPPPALGLPAPPLPARPRAAAPPPPPPMLKKGVRGKPPPPAPPPADDVAD